MNARPGRGPALGVGLVLAALTLGLAQGAAAAPPAPASGVKRRPSATLERSRPLATAPRPAARPPRWLRATPAEPPVATPDPGDRPTSRAFLIYLVDGGEPIVVSEYTEASGEIVFEKYGGVVRIPTYEILRIVADTPHPAERTANLPAPAVRPETENAPLRPESDLYVTLRGGGQMRATALDPEGERVRVSMANGAFTVARSELVSVVRVPPTGSETPEAWLSVLVTEGEPDGNGVPTGLVPATPDPRLPYQSSGRPHFVRLANGQLMRVEGFWVEDGEFRFERLGGIVGVALSEVMRLFPEDIAPVRGRTPVRFARRLGPELLEVGVRSGLHRVRLVGIEPVPRDTWTAEDPWRLLEAGAIIHLEFDRQRYDANGNWLAYVFLPSGRMLNAELVRLGLARPLGDGRNARYLDLFHELAGVEDEQPRAE